MKDHGLARGDPVAQRKAFTLIEMIMVLVIVALMAVIAVPQWNKLENAMELETETQKLASKLREVQQNAVAQQKKYKIVFEGLDYTERYYTVYRKDGSDFIRTEGPVSVGDVLQTIVFDTPGTLTFDKFGAPMEGGFILFTIPIGNNNFGMQRIDVEPVTGKVQVQ